MPLVHIVVPGHINLWIKFHIRCPRSWWMSQIIRPERICVAAGRAEIARRGNRRPENLDRGPTANYESIGIIYDDIIDDAWKVPAGSAPDACPLHRSVQVG